MDGVEALIRGTDDPEVVVTEITHHGYSKAAGQPYRHTALGVIRVRDGGEITDEFRPGSPVYACALGGADGRTLFACAAPDFFEEARKAAREGRLLATRVAVPAA